MHKLLFSIVLLLSSNVFAQTFIGIPFLDKCIKFSACDLCNIQNPKSIDYLDSIDLQLEKITEENEWPLKKLAFINEKLQQVELMNTSSEAEQFQKKEILGTLILLKVNLLMDDVVTIKNTVYNLSSTNEYSSFPNFIGVTEINELIDEVIKLNISESTNNYCREIRMKYMVESSAFDEISPGNRSWYEMKNIKNLKAIPDDRLNAAKLFLKDEEITSFVPFSTFFGLGMGVNGANGKNTWRGFEISHELVYDYSNPFQYNNPFSNVLHGRISLIGTSYLWNMNDRSKRDLTIHILNFKHPLFNINLFQFGAHYGIADKAKGFYRPEIGFSYGILKVGYSYNLTFDKSLRSQTEKSMLTFGISYPLFRIGDYYY